MDGNQSGVIPRRTEGFVVERVPEGAVLRRSERDVALSLNATALALWELCDGETGVEEMLTAVCALFDVRPDRARADVERLLGDLTRSGAIS